uniref:Uncharacterized protein n=1 Tax=Romanomermis culicivorax TaxID=13658 RepID=A0A915KWI3_ROMCU
MASSEVRLDDKVQEPSTSRTPSKFKAPSAAERAASTTAGASATAISTAVQPTKRSRTPLKILQSIGNRMTGGGGGKRSKDTSPVGQASDLPRPRIGPDGRLLDPKLQVPGRS